MSFEFLLNQSPLTHLETWGYGIVCFVVGAGLGFILGYRFMKKRTASTGVKK